MVLTARYPLTPDNRKVVLNYRCELCGAETLRSVKDEMRRSFWQSPWSRQWHRVRVGSLGIIELSVGAEEREVTDRVGGVDLGQKQSPEQAREYRWRPLEGRFLSWVLGKARHL